MADINTSLEEIIHVRIKPTSKHVEYIILLRPAFPYVTNCIKYDGRRENFALSGKRLLAFMEASLRKGPATKSVIRGFCWRVISSKYFGQN